MRGYGAALYGKVSWSIGLCRARARRSHRGAVGGRPPAGTPAMPERPRCFTQPTTARSFFHCAPDHHKSPRTDPVAWRGHSPAAVSADDVHDGRPPANPYRSTRTRCRLTGELEGIRQPLGRPRTSFSCAEAVSARCRGVSGVAAVLGAGQPEPRGGRYFIYRPPPGPILSIDLHLCGLDCQRGNEAPAGFLACSAGCRSVCLESRRSAKQEGRALWRDAGAASSITGGLVSATPRRPVGHLFLRGAATRAGSLTVAARARRINLSSRASTPAPTCKPVG